MEGFLSDKLQQYIITDVVATGRELGHGAYGEVIEMKTGGQIVAGKRIHSELLKYDKKADLRHKFEEECIRLSTLNHPNLVTFLGVHFEKKQPLLIMEYLPFSLTRFINEQESLHTLLKTSILLDISNGMLYLHSQNPPIIHRDLTANNVLLTVKHRAKIADLGVSRVFNPDPTKNLEYFSACPGMASHMPPEALATTTMYRLKQEDVEKLDVFSFGNIMLHVFAHEFPSLLPPYDDDTMHPRSEVERRQHLIDKIQNKSIQSVCIRCLNNSSRNRPATKELVEFFQKELQVLSLDSVNELRKSGNGAKNNSVKKESLNRPQDVSGNLSSKPAKVAHKSIALTKPMPMEHHPLLHHTPSITVPPINILPPGKPVVIKITHDSVALTWEEPSNREHIVQYKVQYKLQSQSDDYAGVINVDKNFAMICSLEAKTTYLFNVVACCDDGKFVTSEDSDYVTTDSLMVKAPDKPFATEVTETSVTLQWNMSSDCTVTHYSVQYCNKENRIKWTTFEHASNSALIADLRTGRSYIFKVAAHYKNGVSEYSEESDPVVTEIMVPNIPSKPVVTHKTHNAMMLKWSMPDKYINSVQYYTVYYLKFGKRKWKMEKSDNECMQIEDLVPSTAYIFKVVAHYIDSNTSEESEISDVITTLGEVCGQPGKPQISTVTNNKVELIWNSPDNAHVVKFYKVFCYIPSDTQAVQELQTNNAICAATITSLMPNTEYVFTVIGVCESGMSEESLPSNSVTTKKEICTAPGHPIANGVTETTIHLQWAEPDKNPHLVSNYLIYYCKQSDSSKIQWRCIQTCGPSTSATVDLLSPNTRYRFKVAALCGSHLEKSDESDESKVILTLPEMCSKPGKPIFIQQLHNAVKLQWKKPDKNSHLVKQYHVYYSLLGAPNNFRVITTGATEVFVKGLLHSSEYFFKVAAECEHGLSEESVESDTFRTPPEKCGKPGRPRATAVTHNTITLEWEEPQNKHLVKCYHIAYRPNNQQMQTQWKNTPDNRNRLLIDSLHSSTPYIFGVKAEGHNSDKSEFSDTSEVITTSIAISSAPGKPIAEPALVKYNSVCLRWTPPQQSSNVVKQYTVGYYLSNDPMRSILNWHRTPDNTNELTISDLHPNTGYVFIVFAKCDAGYSQPSLESDVILTMTEVCSSPGKPYSSEVSYNNIILEWDPPEEGVEFIKFYAIYYHEIKSDEMIRVRTANTETQKVIHKLKHNTVYLFKVIAHCFNGQSLESEESNPITTSEEVCSLPDQPSPSQVTKDSVVTCTMYGVSKDSEVTTSYKVDKVCSKPGKPSIASVTDKSVTLTWMKPDDHAELVEHYCVSYCMQQQPTNWKEEVTAMPSINLLLEPGESYYVKVSAHCLSATSQTSDIASITVPPSSIVPPGKPVVVNKTHDSVALTWEAPSNKECIVQYQVQYVLQSQSDDYANVVNVDKNFAMISPLEAKSTYLFNVVAYYDNGNFVTSEDSDYVTTDSLVLETPDKPFATEVTESTVTLQWNVSSHHAVTHYSVQYCNKENMKKWTTFEHDASNSALINDLRTGRSYIFRVAAHYKNGISEYSEESDPVVTKILVPNIPSKPVVTHRTHNSITLTWSMPDKYISSVEYYTIHYVKSGKSKWKMEKSDNECAQIEDLVPCTAYTFKVVAHYIDSNTSDESESSDVIYTLGEVCGQPGKPQISAVASNKVELTWNNPDNARVVKFYKVFCYIPSDTQVVQELQTSNAICAATIASLMPNTEYVFTVVGVCESGVSEESLPSNSVTTEKEICTAPGCPIANNVTETTVDLQWTEPDKNPHLVNSYIVYYCSRSNSSKIQWRSILIDGLSTSATIDLLFPNTRYSFKVAALCGTCLEKSDESEESKVILTLPELCSKPGKPIFIHKLHNAVKLQWKTPDKNPHLVKQYHVYFSLLGAPNNFRTITVGSTEAVVNGLLPNSEYVFKVAAECEHGLSEKSDESDILKTPPQNCSKPGRPRATAVTHDTITLEWEEPQNKDLVKCYHIAYHPNYQQMQTQLKCTPDNRNRFAIDSLYPSTPYIFGVKAEGCNSYISEFSDTSEVITTSNAISSAPGKPIAEPALVNYNSVCLKWAPPQQNSDLVRHYTVGYYLSNDPMRSILKWHQTPDNATELTISDLHPNRGYVFKVFAQCDIGYSQPSLESDVILTKTEVCSSPGKPHSSEVSYNNVILEWDPPEEGAEFVQCYDIHYHQLKSKKMSLIETTDAHTQKVVHKLRPNTVYFFKVIAHCLNGRLVESEESNPITTSEEVCSPPGQPSPSQVTKNSVALTWAKPVECAHLITGYRILYRSTNSSKWSSAKTSGVYETIDVKNLSPGTSYHFKVIADCGSGPHSKESILSERVDTRALKIVEKMVPKLKLIESKEGTLQFYELNSVMVCRMKNNEKKLANYTFGKLQKRNPYPEKVLMILGATGAGKSTLINGVVNYIFGVEWEDSMRLKLIFEDTARSQAHSQTDWITAYTFYYQEGFPFRYTLTIIDTPGFGDTEGLSRDKQLVSQIQDLFDTKSGIDHLNGIGFITQASLARLTPTQRYIFDSILALFGKDIKDKILAMTTFADGADPPVMEAIKEAKVPCQQYFKFNNSGLYNSTRDNFTKMYWHMGVQSFKQFFDFLSTSESRSLTLTKEVIKERQQLEMIIYSMQQQLNQGLYKMDECIQEEQILKTHEADIIANKAFDYTIDVTKLKKIDLKSGEYVTNCLKCNFTCHYPCTIVADEEKYNCQAMHPRGDRDAKCKCCPGLCPWSSHVNVPYRIEVYQEEETRTSEELKERYQQALHNKEDKEDMISKMQKEIDDLFNDVKMNIFKVNQCLKRLDEIALKPNPLTDVDYIDMMIESEKQEAKPGFRMRIKHLEEVRKEAVVLHNLSSDEGAMDEAASVDARSFFDSIKDWWYHNTS